MPAHRARNGDDTLGARAILAGIATTLVIAALGGLLVVRVLNPLGAAAAAAAFVSRRR